MKLTTKQLRKIIKEELTEVYPAEQDRARATREKSSWQHRGSLEFPEDEDEDDWDTGETGYEMNQDAYDIYDQAIRLTYDQLSRLIGHLEVYRDNPESARTK